MASATSPSASAQGLPHSKTSQAASSNRRLRMIAAASIRTAGPVAGGVADQAGNALRAAATAASACSISASATWPTIRELWLGSTESSRRLAVSTSRPPIDERIIPAELRPRPTSIACRIASRLSARAKSMGGSFRNGDSADAGRPRARPRLSAVVFERQHRTNLLGIA